MYGTVVEPELERASITLECSAVIVQQHAHITERSMCVGKIAPQRNRSLQMRQRFIQDTTLAQQEPSRKWASTLSGATSSARLKNFSASAVLPDCWHTCPAAANHLIGVCRELARDHDRKCARGP
jgi:hypothetical protein